MTQAPLSNTIQDFWTMVWETQSELIASLNTEAEVKGQRYFPKDGKMDIGPYAVEVKQILVSPCGSWEQRTLFVQSIPQKATKVVMHVQFLTWPPG